MEMDSGLQTEDILSSEGEDVTDERRHKQLLDAISTIDGKKRQKLSQRTVISNQISEFNFTASKDNANLVKLHELVGSLKESTSHGELKKQLNAIGKKRKTVSTPLPKHERQKISRSTAYETTKTDISKWDPVVRKNRKAEQLHFPLEKQDFKIVTTDQLIKRFQPRTPLERQVAEMLQGSDYVLKSPDQELTPAEQRALKAMDIQEAKERRLELMKHRALLSYQEAKAKRQKKIKSKRYHRLLKKEKLNYEKKMLDKLQEEDPEGYLDKLNQLEKVRAEERSSLKHRGGSKFAKRQMIYAKYDDRARQNVEDMLQKSRQLTKKVDIESDSEEEKFPDSGVVAELIDDSIEEFESSNPWMARPTASGKQKSSFSRPEAVIQKKGVQSEFSRPGELVNYDVDKGDKLEDSGNDQDNQLEDFGDEHSDNGVPVIIKQNFRGRRAVEAIDLSSLDKTEMSEDHDSEKSDVEEIIEAIFDTSGKNDKKKKKKKCKRGKKKKAGNNNESSNSEQVGEEVKRKDKTVSRQEEMFVEKLESDEDSEDEFEDMIEAERKRSEMDSENVEEDFEDERNHETLKRKRTMEEVEGFSENDDDGEVTLIKKKKSDIRKMEISKNDAGTRTKADDKEAFVDPKKMFTMETKLRQVGSDPDIVVNEDDSDVDTEEQQRMTIAQAFADDDVIEEFSQEKEDAIEKDKPKDIDLTLPGWGSWGGEGIKVSKRKRKRFTIKAPPPLPRKDTHLGHVIMNEGKMGSLSKHLVNEIPFPYINAEQYEKSIRAPIGKTWNPETIYNQMVKPKVVTELGKVITPMDKSEVFKYVKDKKKSDVDFDDSGNGEMKKTRTENKKKTFKRAHKFAKSVGHNKTRQDKNRKGMKR